MSLRTLPLRLEIYEGESADSWIEALARRYRTSPRSMLPLLGLRTVDHISTLLAKTEPVAWDRAAIAAGLEPARLHAAAGTRLTAITPLRLIGTRFCPACLAESGGRWQLAWRWNWSVACQAHRMVLAERCPDCGKPVRTRIAAGKEATEPGTCTNIINGHRRCGTDLTQVQVLAASEDVLDVQRWIEQLAAGLTSSAPAGATAVFEDLPAVTTWLARATPAARLERGRRGHGTVPEADAAQTADLIAQARIILTGDDEAAIDALRQVTSCLPTGWRNPPPGMGHYRWRALGPTFPNRYLRAADLDLHPTDRLRIRTVTTQAARVGADIRDRTRMLPQLLWPEWTARLLPANGFLVEQFRAVMSASILMLGSSQRSHAVIAAPLNPHLRRSWISVAFQSLDDIAGEESLRPVLILLCRLADHLDQHGCLIDYQRRREVTAGLSMAWSYWRDLACGAGAHPGDPVPAGRLLHAQRHLHQLLTGSDLADPSHRLAFRDAADRSRYLAFTARLSTPLRRAFHQEAERFLAERGIDEPVTWHPPLHLADGLELPGIDLDLINLELIKRIVIDEGRPPRAAAEQLGVHVEHVRIALERLDRPERAWSYRDKPEAWKREQLLTREYFEREYLGARRSLRQIGEELGLNRSTIGLYAQRHGIETDQIPRRRIPIDEAWLREQYIRHQRSTADLANEIGVTQMTVNNALARLGVQRRPAGVASHPQMLTTLDQRISRDIRAAVEGSLDGWKRLRRFQIAIALPTLKDAKQHLGLPKAALVSQLQRLETDIGDELFTRSTPIRPQAPTPRGKKLLQILDRPHITALMTEALGADMDPMPNPSAIEAAVERFNQPRKNPGPLKPFDDIAVERIRIMGPTLRLIRDLVEHGDPQFYGHEVIARTGIDAGTLYPALHRLRDAGWLASWPEPEHEWLAGAPPGRGPGRRRTYYALTPEGRSAAEREIHKRTSTTNEVNHAA